MRPRYAVLEWEEDDDATASVIAKDCLRKSAEMFVRIAPAHLHREIVTMEELERAERA